MTSLPQQIEIDRLLNLVHGFGWKETEKKITDSEIIITIKKETPKEKLPAS